MVQSLLSQKLPMPLFHVPVLEVVVGKVDRRSEKLQNGSKESSELEKRQKVRKRIVVAVDDDGSE